MARLTLEQVQSFFSDRALRRVPIVRSLRFQVLVAILAVLLVPQLLVYGWLAVERRFATRMLHNAEFSATEAVQHPERIGEIATTHAVRIRVIDRDGHVLSDFDHDRGRDISQRIGELFLGGTDSPSLDEFDEITGPLALRPEIERAAAGAPASGCRSTPEATLLVCHAVARVEGGFVYVQDSSRRPIAHLSYLRFQLPRLFLVTLPFALFLGWWMGRRVVRPILQLRRQAIAKTEQPAPRPDLAIKGGGEIFDLAAAFNKLLETLEERRGANEAFVADLVHEFKNPVATVRACADALAEGSTDERRAARLSRLLKESSVRLDTLVSQFLELARAEAGMLHEPWSRVDLAALAQGVLTSMGDDERFAGVGLSYEGPDKAEIVGVPHRFESVVKNLVENAASFSGEGGEVVASITETDAQIRLDVSDTGPGIAADDLPKVFTRFFTTRGRERGSGLGLALVRAVVEAHGGTVNVSSSPGEGATFSVLLPRAPAAVEPAS